MRKDGETDEQRRAVRSNIPPADFVNCKRYRGPEQRADQAVCVRHVIKIERISRVIPGTKRTFSIPSRTNGAHKKSSNCTATNKPRAGSYLAAF